MNFRLVKILGLSGEKATIYTVILEEDEPSKKSLFDHFLDENNSKFREEVKDIVKRIKAMGHKTGATDIFFKDWEGKPGDGVCALFDSPDKHLRLYCIRFGNAVLVVGGGGHKPKSMKALQESKKLAKENDLMKIVSIEIAARIRDRELTWSQDGNELEGDFKFYDNE